MTEKIVDKCTCKKCECQERNEIESRIYITISGASFSHWVEKVDRFLFNHPEFGPLGPFVYAQGYYQQAFIRKNIKELLEKEKEKDKKKGKKRK